MKLLAQNLNVGGQQITGPLVGITNIGDLVSSILKLLIPIGGIILVLVLISGGYDFMSSQGDPAKLKTAWAKITAGIIGFILLVLSFVIVRIIAALFGLNTGIL
ncbi:MAG: hypothetical protein Q7R95_01600 [bacterium]|nr:hypothetical protein [bacterium]